MNHNGILYTSFVMYNATKVRPIEPTILSTSVDCVVISDYICYLKDSLCFSVCSTPCMHTPNYSL